MEKIKEGMPNEWVRLVESEAGVTERGEVEMYVGEGERRVSLTSVKTRVVYKCLRVKEVRRPAAEKVWERVVNDVRVEQIWKNLRVKWNCHECENFDFLLRHNRVFNNLIISKFDATVRKECDVCSVGVETCLHEFVECSGLRDYFERLKDLITRCWSWRYVERMDWKELWLRNLAHYDRRVVDVWAMFKSVMKRDISALFHYIEREEFHLGFVEGSTLVGLVDGKLQYDFG
ncbi:uncharacterized protein LOC117809082 [Notolabrus celidotus]|uniref:uncharacterized protein LOC117809082 n=1 Tax=Notolabrus celidotus TaxID=1203425 RepID=UPI00148FC98D|nr:uncharacterized protein LOC117809082 [Notolabrus celidotus]